jgi:hypothetical protein
MMVQFKKPLSIVTGVIALLTALVGFAVIQSHAGDKPKPTKNANNGGVYSTTLGF